MESFFLPGFILEGSGSDEEENQQVDNAAVSSDYLFAMPTLTSGPNPWEEPSAPRLPDVPSDLKLDIDSLLSSPAPAPSQQAALPLNLTRQLSMEATTNPKGLNRHVLDDFSMPGLESFKPPPGFDRVPSLSSPQPFAQSERRQFDPLLTPGFSAGLSSSSSPGSLKSIHHTESDTILATSLFSDDAARVEQLFQTVSTARGLALTDTAYDEAVETGIQSKPVYFAPMDAEVKEPMKAATTATKSWASVAVEATQKTFVASSETRSSTRRAPVIRSTDPGHPTVPNSRLIEAASKSNVYSNRASKVLPQSSTAGSAATVSRPCGISAPVRMATSLKSSEGTIKLSTGSLEEVFPKQAVVRPQLEDRREQDRSPLTTGGKIARQAQKQEDGVGGRSSPAFDAQSRSSSKEMSKASKPPASVGADNESTISLTALGVTWFRYVFGVATLAIQALSAFCAMIWPAFTAFGVVFAFMAKSMIICALFLANTCRYAAAEVEHNESGSFFCYLVFYVVPNGCDLVMSLFSLPHFAPHVSTSVALYLLCQSTGGGKRKPFRSKAHVDKQAERLCLFILRSLRWSIPFDLFLEGFSLPNTSIMMLDVSSRLMLAYVLSLLRSSLILSPVAWVCWSVQIVLSVYLPCNKLTECLLLLLGLASVRLCAVVQATEGAKSNREV